MKLLYEIIVDCELDVLSKYSLIFEIRGNKKSDFRQ